MNPFNHKTDSDRVLWEKKAIAFVTRSHQQLWGKNNEDPLAWLFEQGFENQFAKEMHLGWNKHSQTRNFDTWGLCPGDSKTADKKLVLPAGIVIPHIINQNLKSITIHTNKGDDAILLPGSLLIPMVLGNNRKALAVLTSIIDGLYLFQETRRNITVVITSNIKSFHETFKKRKWKNALWCKKGRKRYPI